MCCTVFCRIDHINKRSQNASLWNVSTQCVSFVFVNKTPLLSHCICTNKRIQLYTNKKGTFPQQCFWCVDLFSPPAGDRSSQTRIQGLWFWAEPLVGLVFPLQGLARGRASLHVVSHLRPVEGEPCTRSPMLSGHMDTFHHHPSSSS